MQRKIIHIDMDCFYAAVEMRENPALKNIPMAVGGNGKRAVLSTCNYVARQYGLRSAMSAVKAKLLCPQLVIVPGNMSLYKEVSAQIHQIFQKYTDKIEPLSLDEAYLDVSESTLFNGSASLLAEHIRKEIFETTRLTASAGIAGTKFLAKIASDENKPNGQCVIAPDDADDFVRSLPLKKLSGVGKKTAVKLANFGLYTCEDVRQLSEEQMVKMMGKFGGVIYQRSMGIDNRSLELNRVRKSVGVETTLSRDIEGIHSCLKVMYPLQEKLLKRLSDKIALDAPIEKQGIKIKFDDFKQTTVEQSSSKLDLALFSDLLEKALKRSNGRKIRLIGVSVGLANADSKYSRVKGTVSAKNDADFELSANCVVNPSNQDGFQQLALPI